MKKFKVTYIENIPASAYEIDLNESVGLKIIHPSGQRLIKWIIINATDEEDSLAKAERIAADLLLPQ